MRLRCAAGTAALFTLVPAALCAQSWRTLDASRAMRDSAPMSMRIEYTYGELQARPTASDSVLYDVHLRYDALRAQPLVAFDSATRRATLGSRARERAPQGGDGARGEALIGLARGVPLDLSIRLSVATGAFELGGLALRKLAVFAAAGESRIRFETANVGEVESLELDVSAATLNASRLANANAARIRVGTRVGTAELDLSGVWTRDMELDVDVTLGSVTIHVPRDVGIELDAPARPLIASVEAPGLHRDGTTHTSANFTTAPHKLRIRANATFGKVEVLHDR